MKKPNETIVPTLYHLWSPIDGRRIVTLHSDGSVDVHPDVTLDEAATAFWNAVRDAWDNHVTPPAEIELRTIHATAVAAVMAVDKKLRPEVDDWWQLYLRSVLTQSSRPWFTSTAKDDATREPEAGAPATAHAAIEKLAEIESVTDQLFSSHKSYRRARAGGDKA